MTSEEPKKLPKTGAWDYSDESECGPCHWPNADGHHQSPINIDLGSVKCVTNVEPFAFRNYSQPISGEIFNNGHSVQVTVKPSHNIPEVDGGGLDQTYQLIQYHFHWGQHDNIGSEHTLAGLHFPAEMHLVHRGVKDPEKLAVFAIFFIINEKDDAVRVESDLLRKIIDPTKSDSIHDIIMEHKLPHNRRSFWRYSGSLTTPPCSEIVTWTLFTEPIGITKYQLAMFRSVHDKPGHILEKNYRPTQELFDREVLHVTTK